MVAEITFWDELKDEVQGLGQQLRYGLARSGAALRNQVRLARQHKLDYVVLPIGGPLPERSSPPRSFIQRQLPLPPQPLSLQKLNYRLELIRDADNVKGVVFVFQGFSAGLASLQNFRTAVQRLKDAGKKSIVYTPYLNLAHYYAASAADMIIAPPSATFEVLGLHSEVIFFREALDRLGIETQLFQISPYKTAFDQFHQPDITPEHREQINWLLDDIYDIVSASMAEGRGKSQAEMQALIDRAPLLAEEALQEGLLDHLAYEDELAYLLATKRKKEKESATITDQPTPEEEKPEAKRAQTDQAEDGASTTKEETNAADDPQKKKKRPKARLTNWPQAQDLMLEKVYHPLDKHIGVVSLEGTIIMGPSYRPPIELPIPFASDGGTGEETINQILRRAEDNKEMAALILHVDSGGGIALASDLIWRQVTRIAQKKPVLFYMGNIAASGGYYVGTAAQHIMSQSVTMTGSIGVVTAHISTKELYDSLSLNRVTFKRGERADLHSDTKLLDSDKQQAVWAGITETYRQFKERVAEGRPLTFDELDPICEGRVWSGRQAVERQLVDSHGDFVDAIEKAAELAGLEVDDHHYIPVRNYYPADRSYKLPRPYESAEALGRVLSADYWRAFLDQPLYLLPFEIKFW